MKKTLSTILALALMLTMLCIPVAASAEQPSADVKIEPRYEEASRISLLMYISEDGEATVQATCIGKSDVTKIHAEVYLEKKVSYFWIRVVNPDGSPSWEDTMEGILFTKEYTRDLIGSGDYRATVYFTLYGDTTETVTATAYKSY